MDKRQFTGKNLEEALSEAARSFSTDKDLLCYNIIHQSSGGLLSRLFSRSVRIEAWVETVKEDLQAAAREVVRQALGKNQATRPNLSPFTQSTIQENKETNKREKFTRKSDAQKEQLFNKKNSSPRQDALTLRPVLTIKSEGVEELFEDYKNLFFAAFNVSNENIETSFSEKEVVVRVSDEGIESFLSKSDKLSLAFEHVFKRIAQKKLGDVSSRISLDAGESAEKREERLIGMARALAEKVRKTGKSVILSSKSSQERRVIHLALDGFVGVATRSVGTGDKRRLVIYSTEKKSGQKNNNQTQSHHKGNASGEKPSRPHHKPRRKYSHHKKVQHNTASKLNTERVGAVSSSDRFHEEEVSSSSSSSKSNSSYLKE